MPANYAGSPEMGNGILILAQRSILAAREKKSFLR
jgi:hypothetical protein